MFDVPDGFYILRNNFYNYDPTTEYDATLTANCLREELSCIQHLVFQHTIYISWEEDFYNDKNVFVLYTLEKGNDIVDYPAIRILHPSQKVILYYLEKILQDIAKGELKYYDQIDPDEQQKQY